MESFEEMNKEITELWNTETEEEMFATIFPSAKDFLEPLGIKTSLDESNGRIGITMTLSDRLPEPEAGRVFRITAEIYNSEYHDTMRMFYLYNTLPSHINLTFINIKVGWDSYDEERSTRKYDSFTEVLWQFFMKAKVSGFREL